jgi:asparagine synthase (glutamine-hydrolysing)
LLPGTYLEWQDGRSRIERYWEPDLAARVDTTDERELAKRFEKLFVQAVHRQLVSEVPVGSCLSGGLDSSSIVAVINSLIRKHVPEEAVIGERQKTFSAMFPGEANDETDYIHALTAKLPVEEHGVYPKKTDLFDELEQVVYHQDEPFVTTAIFAQWEVMKEASKHVAVTLDGQGADELLAGYFPYYVVYLRQLFKERRYWTALKEMVLSADVLISWSVEPLKERFKLARTVDPKVMLDRGWLKRAKTPPPRPSCRDNLNQRLWEDASIYSLPALLRYGDRNSMAFSVESRVPFLDNDLVDFILSLPPEYKIKNGWNKRIMRKALGKYLPAKIRNRRWKVGFTTPEVAWMRAEKERVLAIFDSRSFRERGYFNADRVIAEFQEFVERKTNNSFVFWRLLNLELWFRVFFDGDVNERTGVLAGQPRQVADG